MATLRVLEAFTARDMARVVQHLLRYESAHIDERLHEIFEALDILRRHPEIGRPAGDGWRELIIGKGARGYVARYRYDYAEDLVEVVALRAQRERGFVGDD